MNSRGAGEADREMLDLLFSSFIRFVLRTWRKRLVSSAASPSSIGLRGSDGPRWGFGSAMAGVGFCALGTGG